MALQACSSTEALYAAAAQFALNFSGDTQLEVFLATYVTTHRKRRTHVTDAAAARALYDKLSIKGNSSAILDVELREFRRIPSEKTMSS